MFFGVLFIAEELEDAWSLLILTEEESVLVVTTGLIVDSDPSVQARRMVGKLITKRPFQKGSMMTLFKNVWRLSRPVEISTMDDNLFLFKFANLRDKERVIDVGPWSFDNQMLVVQDYDGDLRPSDYKFERALVWTKVYGLPMNLLNMDVAGKIGNKIGKLVMVDNSKTRSGWAKNVRMRVEINFTKPLLRFVTIDRGGGKGVIRGRVTFERLPLFC